MQETALFRVTESFADEDALLAYLYHINIANDSFRGLHVMTKRVHSVS